MLTQTRIVFGNAAKTVELPWPAVAGCVLFETSMVAGSATDFLGVAATDDDAVVWVRGASMGKADRNVSGYEFTVPAEAFAGDVEAVMDTIHLYVDDPRRRRSIGSESEHARLLREVGETAARA